jgi:IS1 family transposase/lambda repressor-like predicted transcriptional regulator
MFVFMNKLDAAKRAQIIALLCEGSSMRSISRVADVSINTVTKLLIDAGIACTAYHDQYVTALKTKRVQRDEVWSFCYSKEKNVPTAKRPPEGAGDLWTWTALDADSKLMISWGVGDRHAGVARVFFEDIAGRLASRVQLTTDGHRAYLDAVPASFDEVDFAQLVKLYGEAPGGSKQERRYSPAECTGTIKTPVTGNPDPKHISTSYVERQNLNMRMGMRRFTRLTNAFSKKVDNHCHALAVYFVFYNFVRIHKSLRTSPAMAAGVTDKLWSVEDMVALVERYEARLLANKKRRAPTE